MPRTICTFKMAFNSCFKFNYEFNRASNLKRNWVDLGLLKLRGKFRENWEGIQMQYIHVNSQKVNLK